MATPFDETILPVLSPIFVFLLVFAVTYALMAKTKYFGDKAGFNIVIALCISLLFLIVPEARVVMATFTPWFVILLLLTLFIFLFFMFLGVKEKTLTDMAEQPGFSFWAVLILIILFLVALTKAFGPFLLVNQQPGFWNSVKRVVLHPKTLGALFILAVASYAARYIGSNE